MSIEPTIFEDAQSTHSLAGDGKALSEDLKSKVTSALGRIKALEGSEPWGNDEPGKAFAGAGEEGYVFSSTQYHENAPKAGEAAAGAFGAVQATVDKLTGVDVNNTTTIDKSVAT